MIQHQYWSFRADNPAWGRWDQFALERMLVELGSTRLPDYMSDTDWQSPPPDGDGAGRVVIVPCGTYSGHRVAEEVAEALTRRLAELDWCVVIGTSDEDSSFPWEDVFFPEHSKFWVMTPLPEKPWPMGARFIGDGCPVLPEPSSVARSIDVVFRGQNNHLRRRQAIQAARILPKHLNVQIHPTQGFAQGLSPAAYMQELSLSKIVLCPSGIRTQDSFRVFEALEAGCVPIVDGLRPDGGGRGYWEMLGMAHLFPIVYDWSKLGAEVDKVLANWDECRRFTGEHWDLHKKQMAENLMFDFYSLQQRVYASDTGEPA